MSAPAAKALCEPVRTMALMEESASKAFMAALSSRMSGVKRALRALGREISTDIFLADALCSEILCRVAYLGQLRVVVSTLLCAHSSFPWLSNSEI